MKTGLASVAAALLLGSALTASAAVLVQPKVRADSRHDTSPPLRAMAVSAKPGSASAREVPPPGHAFELQKGPAGRDTAVQEQFLPRIHTQKVLTFNAVREDEQNAQVPDTNGAVGATQFVEITNFDYEIYDKATHKLVLKPTNTNTIFQGFGGQCENTDPGDPVVVWDKLANRWLVSYMNYESNNMALCIAVSTTSDATGAYNRYEYDYGGTLPDYPKYAVWPDAYYGSDNLDGGQAQACAYDRNAMLAGSTAAQICFTPNAASLLPSDLDGTTPPPAGAPDHYVDLGNTTNQLQEFDFHVDFSNPKKSSFTGPNNITVPNFSEACQGFGNCIPQPSGGEQVEGLGDRLLFRLAYRNFGDHEAMVVAHSVVPGQGSSAQSAMRWYELRATPVGSAFALYQSGTYQDKTNSLWMGSAAMDKQGNMALGMSVSSSSKDPGIWYTGRLSGDPLGKLEVPTVAAKGTAIETGDSQRWGDYSSMSVDPADDCTFWYSQMYYNRHHGGNASGDWDTKIVAFRFDSCQ